MNKVYFSNDNFSMNLQLEEEIFVHLDVKKWNKSVLKEVKEVFEDLLNSASKLGFENIYAYTPNTKFVDMIKPYTEEGEFKDEGVTYKVISWKTKEE